MTKQKESFIESLEKIEIKQPTELVIQQIKRQISSGKLVPGEKLPPERELANRLNVGRGYIRQAIKKLEFYGILKTIPHKGTVVASLSGKALEGLISNVLEMESEHFIPLVETRIILERNAARLAAIRATDEEIEKIQAAHDDYQDLVLKGTPNIEIDFLFHLSIAEFCKNPVLRSMISLMTPDVISYSMKVTRTKKAYMQLAEIVMSEHHAIMDALRSRDPDLSAKAMEQHLNRILQLVKDIEEQKDAFNFTDWIDTYKKKKNM